MTSLDKAVIARLTVGEHHFEILVDPKAAADLIDGKDVDIVSNLAIDEVFKDARKGERAPEEAIKSCFGTTDIGEVAKQIILRGNIQLTTEQRHEMQKRKFNQIVEIIAKNAMDPRTKTPHPRQRIELAIEEAGVHIDPFKPVDEQVKEVIDKIRPILPISMEQVKISVKIPAAYIGKAYGIVRNFGTLVREEWQSDGSWTGVVQLPAGLQTEFYEKLNDITKGNVETKLLG
ncbi:MAG TPA: ribosome assembly factor SBDS [Thermoplasmatales archaeon]|nr:ribosome assembly factor SBDS [Thermoplasmatales archaeon]